MAKDAYESENYEKAEEMANKFVDSRPQLPEGYNLLGTINSARGELSKAKTQYEKGISLKNPNIYAVKELEKIMRDQTNISFGDYVIHQNYGLGKLIGLETIN